MILQKLKYTAIILLFFLGACRDAPKEKTELQNEAKPTENLQRDTSTIKENLSEIKKEEEPFVLTEENAIDFFFNYQKGLPTTRVKLTTNLGNFTVELYDNVPYHKANFIYLTKQGYFDNTMFHRVVKDFIIQGVMLITRQPHANEEKLVVISCPRIPEKAINTIGEPSPCQAAKWITPICLQVRMSFLLW